VLVHAPPFELGVNGDCPIFALTLVSFVTASLTFASFIGFVLRSGAGYRPFRRFQVEQTRHRSSHLLLFLLLWKFLELTRQEAGHFLDNLGCDGVQ
jgi:hypothetical protein